MRFSIAKRHADLVCNFGYFGGPMRRREFMTLVGGAAAATSPLAAIAQSSDMPVVGWLGSRSHVGELNFSGFVNGLVEAGFVEGRNVRIEPRSAGGQYERLVELAADFVRQKVNVIFAGGPPAALAAKRATETIPVVFTSGADPVQLGLVQSINKPGANVTGIYIQFGELVGKRLAFLREIVPSTKRVAILINPSNPADNTPTVNAATAAARTHGFEIKIFNATTAEDLDAAFASLVGWQAGGVLISADSFFIGRGAQIEALALRYRLPTCTSQREGVLAGSLVGYGPNLATHYAQAAGYVGRILKGEKPGDIPVLLPTSFHLMLNLKTAKALGITIPDILLGSADEVIE
jgi:putative tryptophan/tyrosine transport system substrate-binding protein